MAAKRDMTPIIFLGHCTSPMSRWSLLRGGEGSAYPYLGNNQLENKKQNWNRIFVIAKMAREKQTVWSCKNLSHNQREINFNREFFFLIDFENFSDNYHVENFPNNLEINGILFAWVLITEKTVRMIILLRV